MFDDRQLLHGTAISDTESLLDRVGCLHEQTLTGLSVFFVREIVDVVSVTPWASDCRATRFLLQLARRHRAPGPRCPLQVRRANTEPQLQLGDFKHHRRRLRGLYHFQCSQRYKYSVRKNNLRFSARRVNTADASMMPVSSSTDLCSCRAQQVLHASCCRRSQPQRRGQPKDSHRLDVCQHWACRKCSHRSP